MSDAEAGVGNGAEADRPDAPPPPPLRTKGLVSHTERIRIGMTLEAFWPWFVRAPLERVLPGGGGLPTVTGTTHQTRTPWGEAGARRRVHLSDGSSVIEGVLEATPPTRLRYQVWGFGGPARLLLDHAQGRFDFVPDDADGVGTQVAWTYAFAPRSPLLRPVVALFAHRRFAVFMRSGLAAMRAAAEEGSGT